MLHHCSLFPLLCQLLVFVMGTIQSFFVCRSTCEEQEGCSIMLGVDSGERKEERELSFLINRCRCWCRKQRRKKAENRPTFSEWPAGPSTYKAGEVLFSFLAMSFSNN